MSHCLPKRSARPRPGLRFEPIQEQRLQTVALRAIAELGGTSANRLVLTEMLTPYGVPDFVVADLNEARLAARLQAGVGPILNEADAAIIATLSATKPATPERIASLLNWPEPSVRRRFQRLLSQSAIRKIGLDSYVTVRGLTSVGTITAVEMKLEDWRRGLRQCRRYRVWADRYLLILDRVPEVSLPQLLTQVAADRGGLIISGSWRARPRGRNHDKVKRMWASEHVVAAIGHQPSIEP